MKYKVIADLKGFVIFNTSGRVLCARPTEGHSGIVNGRPVGRPSLENDGRWVYLDNLERACIWLRGWMNTQPDKGHNDLIIFTPSQWIVEHLSFTAPRPPKARAHFLDGIIRILDIINLMDTTFLIEKAQKDDATDKYVNREDAVPPLVTASSVFEGL